VLWCRPQSPGRGSFVATRAPSADVDTCGRTCVHTADRDDQGSLRLGLVAEVRCAGCTEFEDLTDVVKKIVGVWGQLDDWSQAHYNGATTRIDVDISARLGVT